MPSSPAPRRPGLSGWALLGCGCGLAGVIGIALVFVAITFEMSMAQRNPAWDRDNFARCEDRLRYLAKSLQNYASEHRGQLPARLEALYPQYMTSLDYLHCPREGQDGAEPFRYTPQTAINPTDPLVTCVNHGQGKIILQRDLKLHSPSWGDRKRKDGSTR